MEYFTEEFAKTIEKIICNHKLDRTDEENVYNVLARVYGENNVLTEIVVNENGNVEYFGCAVCDCGEWRVYNLAGTGVGVVVKMGNRPRLALKVG